MPPATESLVGLLYAQRREDTMLRDICVFDLLDGLALLLDCCPMLCAADGSKHLDLLRLLQVTPSLTMQKSLQWSVKRNSYGVLLFSCS